MISQEQKRKDLYWTAKELLGPGKFTAPIFSYDRSTKLGKAVIAGQFYRGCRSPKLNGIYFWGDYYSGLLFRLKESKATGTWQNKEVEMCDSKVCKYPVQSTFTGHMTSFGLDEEGELYMTSSEGMNPYKTNGRVYRLVEPSQPGDPEPCRVHATQQATETNPILQNLQKLITNPSAAISEEPETKVSKESQLVEKKSDIQPDVVKVTITNPSTSPTPKPHENGNIGMFESSFLTNMMQEIAAPLIGNTGEDDGVDQTEAVADSTNRADDSDNASQEKLMADTSDKDDDSGNVGQEKIAAGTADKADDSDNVGKANLMADKTDKADDSGNAGQENFSPPDTSDGNMETNNDHILDILKKGNLKSKEARTKFLGKLLARLYNADFSSQDEGSVSKSTKSYETIFDDGEDTNKVK